MIWYFLQDLIGNFDGLLIGSRLVEVLRKIMSLRRGLRTDGAHQEIFEGGGLFCWEGTFCGHIGRGVLMPIRGDIVRRVPSAARLDPASTKLQYLGPRSQANGDLCPKSFRHAVNVPASLHPRRHYRIRWKRLQNYFTCQVCCDWHSSSWCFRRLSLLTVHHNPFPDCHIRRVMRSVGNGSETDYVTNSVPEFFRAFFGNPDNVKSSSAPGPSCRSSIRSTHR